VGELWYVQCVCVSIKAMLNDVCVNMRRVCRYIVYTTVARFK